MKTPGEVLWEDILRSPQEVALRLIYADWLADHNQLERAEFIRVQLELEQFPDIDALRARTYDARDGVSEEWKKAFALHDREMKLLWSGPSMWEANWVKWCWCVHRDEEGRPATQEERGGMVVTPHGSRGLGVTPHACQMPTKYGMVKQIFRNGFVEIIHSTKKDWYQYGPTIVQHSPINQVTLTDAYPFITNTGYGWFNCKSFPALNCAQSCIWEGLWDVVVRGKEYTTSGQTVWLPSATGREVLEQAALQWAREKAGLETFHKRGPEKLVDSPGGGC